MWTEALSLNARGVPSDIPGRQMPDLVIAFGGTAHFAEPESLAGLRAAFPRAQVIGCSTGTTISGQGLSDDTMTALAVGFDNTRLISACVPMRPGESSYDVGVKLGEHLDRPDLRAIFVLSEGLEVNGSELVAGLTRAVAPAVRVSGGLAGDGARFARTYVLDKGVPEQRVVSAIGFYGDHLRIGQGSAGGWDDFGPTRVITRSEGNVLYELDGKPALELYKRYLGDEAANLPASALLYPLKIIDPGNPNEKTVRTVLSVDHDAGSLTFAGDIPEGWHAKLMQGELDRLVDGAQSAAEQAMQALQDGDASIEPALSLLVSCVGRRLLMGQRTEDEVLAVARRVGEKTAQIGFYSYGEIAPHTSGRNSVLHNQTVTVMLMAEVA